MAMSAQSLVYTVTKNLRQSLIILVYLHRQRHCIPEYALCSSYVGIRVGL